MSGYDYPLILCKLRLSCHGVKIINGSLLLYRDFLRHAQSIIRPFTISCPPVGNKDTVILLIQKGTRLGSLIKSKCTARITDLKITNLLILHSLFQNLVFILVGASCSIFRDTGKLLDHRF